MSLIGERCTRRERHSASGVADARADFAALQRLPCFWPEATRASAEAALSAATGDCYLVRLSSQPNHLTVSYREPTRVVYHALLRVVPRGFVLVQSGGHCPLAQTWTWTA